MCRIFWCCFPYVITLFLMSVLKATLIFFMFFILFLEFGREGKSMDPDPEQYQDAVEHLPVSLLSRDLE